MNRPLTLVLMLAVLAGAFTFLGTLLTAPSHVNVAQYGSQVRAAMAAGDFSLVGELSRKALRGEPRFQEAMMFLAINEERHGSQRRADSLWSRLERVSRENIRRGNGRPEQRYYLGWALHGLDRPDEARREWAELVRLTGPGEDGYNRACYLALAGRTDEALAEWERLTESGVGIDLRWARVDPDLDAIRGDPRFEAARQKARQRLRARMENETRI